MNWQALTALFSGIARGDGARTPVGARGMTQCTLARHEATPAAAGHRLRYRPLCVALKPRCARRRHGCNIAHAHAGAAALTAI